MVNTIFFMTDYLFEESISGGQKIVINALQDFSNPREPKGNCNSPKAEAHTLKSNRGKQQLLTNRKQKLKVICLT